LTAFAERLKHASIWWYAFGYFACYWPYSALTKAVTRGYIVDETIPGAAVLPLSVGASVLGMFAFITLMGWWHHATSFELAGKRLPRPTKWTLLSGVCTSLIIGTTTLAYTFDGISIVFAMLLMRGGVLIMSPVIDSITGRHVRWFSWSGLVFSMAALIVAFSEEGGYNMKVLAAVDIGIYLASYFIRLQLMSRLAKSDDRDTTIRYFVEEQLVASPLLFIILVGLAIFKIGEFGELQAQGFALITHPAAIYIIGLGILSQGTGIFGGLILLGREENAYCVPVNRASSILAGVLASTTLAILFAAMGATMPSGHQLAGAGLVITAILFLSIPPLLENRR